MNPSEEHSFVCAMNSTWLDPNQALRAQALRQSYTEGKTLQPRSHVHSLHIKPLLALLLAGWRNSASEVMGEVGREGKTLSVKHGDAQEAGLVPEDYCLPLIVTSLYKPSKNLAARGRRVNRLKKRPLPDVHSCATAAPSAEQPHMPFALI